LKHTNAGQADRVRFSRNRGIIRLLHTPDALTCLWPDEIKMDRETKKKVDAMWVTLGLR
jgi:hypothetical protein